MIEVGVFVEDVIEVCDFPVLRLLIFHWNHLKQVKPLEVSFKPNHVLHHLLIVASKEHSRVVLILNKQLHWTLNQTSHRHAVRLIVRVQVVQQTPRVVLWNIGIQPSPKQLALTHCIVVFALILSSLNFQTMGDFCVQHFHFWLVHS